MTNSSGNGEDRRELRRTLWALIQHGVAVPAELWHWKGDGPAPSRFPKIDPAQGGIQRSWVDEDGHKRYLIVRSTPASALPQVRVALGAAAVVLGFATPAPEDMAVEKLVVSLSNRPGLGEIRAVVWPDRRWGKLLVPDEQNATGEHITWDDFTLLRWTCHNLLVATLHVLAGQPSLTTVGGAGDARDARDARDAWDARDDEDARDDAPPEGKQARYELDAPHGKAYVAYKYGEKALLELNGEKPTDRAVYDWLRNNGMPSMLRGYKLPYFDTWTRQLRRARRGRGEQKYDCRHGRIGRSIVRKGEV